MTNKDKVIAAFLVSVGLFSVCNAMQYVKALSDVQKTELSILASNDLQEIGDSEPLRVVKHG
ncbi:MAG: hypothetical protein WCK75_07355 [Elusimicrobiota bacterium]